jgi:hypothetical protein
VKANVLTYEYGNDHEEKREGTIKLDPKTKAPDWTMTFPKLGRRRSPSMSLRAMT